MEHLASIFNNLIAALKSQHSQSEVAGLALQLNGATKRILKEHKNAGNIEKHYRDITHASNQIFKMVYKNPLKGPSNYWNDTGIYSIPWQMRKIRGAMNSIAAELKVEIEELES